MNTNQSACKCCIVSPFNETEGTKLHDQVLFVCSHPAGPQNLVNEYRNN